MSEVVTVAIVKAQEGKEAELERAVETLVTASHGEEGNLTYAVHRALQEPRTYVFVERYTSPDAFQAHLGSEHFGAAAAQFGDLLDGAPTIVPAEAWVIGDPAKGAL